jgi:hypothetical protein
MDVAEALRWHLAPFIKPQLQHRAVPVEFFEREDDGPDTYQYVRSGMVGDYGDIAEVLGYAIWDLHSFVPKITRDYVLLHAAAAARDGRVVLLPAQREAGKSTTVSALLMAGFSYLSDELGAIDPITAQAFPFEKRITLDQASLAFFPGLEERLQDRSGLSSMLSDRYVRPEDLGAAVGGAGPVAWIVFIGADRGGPPRLEKMSAASAVADLARNAFNLHVYGGDGALLLSKLARSADVYVLEGGSPHERAALLADELR